MKKTLLLLIALLALTTSFAAAAGINLSWDDCGTFGALNKSFACDTNAGSSVLYGSYIPPYGTIGLTSAEILIDLQAASSALPNWWQFKNTGACRLAALTFSADFTSGPSHCVDYWEGMASGGIATYQTWNMDPPVYPMVTQPNRARILAVCAVAAQNARPVDPGTEYYAFQLTLTNARTLGEGALSCAGCSTPVCIVLARLTLGQDPPNLSYRLETPLHRSYVTWQGGVISAPGCPAALPARNTTWGTLKTLHRR